MPFGMTRNRYVHPNYSFFPCVCIYQFYVQPAKQAHELFGTLRSTGKGVARSGTPDRSGRREGGRGRVPISYAPATQAICPASPPHSFGYAIVPMISLIEFSQYLADAEEHLGETISVIQPNMKVPLNEFDGRVQYGEKRRRVGKGWMFRHQF